MEIIIGHATFCGLVCRGTLCVFRTVYRFTQAAGAQSLEMLGFGTRGAQRFCRADDLLGERLVAAVAQHGALLRSEAGFAVCTAVWPREHAARTGRTFERSRFKRIVGGSARESALAAAGVLQDCLAGELLLEKGVDKEWIIESGLIEVPAEGLRPELWIPRLWDE